MIREVAWLNCGQSPLLRPLVEGDRTPVERTVGDGSRMAELARIYCGLPLTITDASVIAVAERLHLAEVASPGRRRYTGVRARVRWTHTLMLVP